jgi:hypothetical protein
MMTNVCCRYISILVLVSIASGGCSDRFESSYPSISDAKNDGAIERGWIPDSLGGSVNDIWETHNLDTNEMWGKFRFPKGEAPLDATKVEVISPEDAAKLRFRDPDTTWWPNVLQPPIDSTELSKEGFKVFKDSRRELFFALSADAGMGFFWGAEQ